MARLWLVALGAASLLSAQPSHGLGLVADDRVVTYPDGSEQRATSPFAFFYSYNQISEITVSGDGLGLDGSAWSQGSGGIDDFGIFRGTTSLFSITFRIDGDGELTLDGSLSSGSGLYGTAYARVLAGAQELFAVELLGDETTEFSFPASLPAGLYTLEAYAAVGTDQIAIFDFTFHVRDSAVPIPEPATVLLLAGGIGWIGARVRRRQSR